MPGTRALASLLLLAAALAAAGAPPAGAEGGAPAPPPPKDSADKEEVHHELVELEPFPRKAPAGETLRLKFKLKGGLRAPVLVLVYPSGAAAYLEPDVHSGNDFEIPFRLDRIGGVHRLALFGRGPAGERLVLETVVKGTSKDGKEIDRDVDIPPADTRYPDLDPEENPLRLERQLFHRMNALRARAKIAPLPWHEGVARAAREQIVEIARHYEETLDARTGKGLILHRIPGAGPDGGPGPTVAERVRTSLAWNVVQPYIPVAVPDRGRGKANFVSEALASPDPSLDHKFEQEMMRDSDLRAPMLSPFLTHAAGAATWRWYGWKKAEEGSTAPRPTEPGPAPSGWKREAIAALVFVQVNDPAAAESYERERREVQRVLGAASKPAERAEALRRLGQTALPESPRLLVAEAAKAKDAAILAGALDGLWLCAPEEARRLSDGMRVRVLQALEDREESRGADALRALAAMRWDVSSRRAGTAGLEEIAKRLREALAAAGKAGAAGKPDEEKAILEDALRRFASLPGADEIEAALRKLAAAGGGPPPGAPPPK